MQNQEMIYKVFFMVEIMRKIILKTKDFAL